MFSYPSVVNVGWLWLAVVPFGDWRRLATLVGHFAGKANRFALPEELNGAVLSYSGGSRSACAWNNGISCLQLGRDVTRLEI